MCRTGTGAKGAADMIVAVIGLGYVGLPLAMAYASAGANVIGVEINELRVLNLRNGKSYISDVDSEVVLANADRFYVTTSYEYIKYADAIFVCVPTPYDKQKRPDLTAIRSAGESIGENIGRDQIIVLESTSWPGTTTKVFRAAIRWGQAAAREEDKPLDRFVLAFASERVNPGSGIAITDIPKVVGVVESIGVFRNKSDEARVVDLFEFAGFKVHLVSSPETAEMSKLLENTFRAVNIALANEMAMLCDKMGLDVWEVVRAAATKPYGFMPFYPSPRVGGHCIPIDPYYLHAAAMEHDIHMRSIETAMAINESMPQYIADLVRKAANDAGVVVSHENTILIGTAYKPGVTDMRGAPWKAISPLLEYATVYERPGDEIIDRAEIAVILVKDTGYDYTRVVTRMAVIVDCCNATEFYSHTDNVTYLGCGMPWWERAP